MLYRKRSDGTLETSDPGNNLSNFPIIRILETGSSIVKHRYYCVLFRSILINRYQSHLIPLN